MPSKPRPEERPRPASAREKLFSRIERLAPIELDPSPSEILREEREKRTEALFRAVSPSD